MIRIKSKRDGFRRCGVAHSAAAKDHPAGRFTKAELAILQAEPMLEVEEIPDADGGVIAETPGDLEKMTVAQLKELLGRLEIEIPDGAKKIDLVELVLANTGGPPAED